MNEHEEQAQAEIEELIETLQHAIESGPWDKSLFLTNIGKELRKLQDELVNAHIRTQPSKYLEASSPEAIQEVYVSLYHAQGEHLARWQSIIANLSDYCKSRPVYTTQEEVEKVILMSMQPRSCAYVVLGVNPEDILPLPSEEAKQEGGMRVSLKDNAIQLDNMIRFVHVSGEYKWINGFLVKTG